MFLKSKDIAKEKEVTKYIDQDLEISSDEVLTKRVNLKEQIQRKIFPDKSIINLRNLLSKILKV